MGLDAERFDHGKTEVSIHKQTKHLDVPSSIATLCKAISKQSRQENKLTESFLLRVLTPEKKPIRRSPVKQFSATPVSASIEDYWELLERRLGQARYENQQFESYWKKRVFEDR